VASAFSIFDNGQRKQQNSRIIFHFMVPVVWTLMLTFLSAGWGMLYPQNATLGLWRQKECQIYITSSLKLQNTQHFWYPYNFFLQGWLNVFITLLNNNPWGHPQQDTMSCSLAHLRDPAGRGVLSAVGSAAAPASLSWRQCPCTACRCLVQTFSKWTCDGLSLSLSSDQDKELRYPWLLQPKCIKWL
jgi:hypothetical protein